ncbi:MAG: excinuclease ABC subunit UvrC [Firmicutes bacterium]|nr:excinuclease ABC subunit UvrC [Bacillota bacterium]
MFDIQENLKKLPDCPGVYMHKDKLGHIIYVGKAISLRNRVRQYFQSSRNMDPKVRSMVSQIAEFEYIKVGSEMEALILECNLIKKHRPKYNILLRDDKTYPYIRITNETYPRVMKTRLIKKDGSRYFGPYSDAGAVNRIVDLLNTSFALKRCSATAFPPGFKPCLNYHIKQCRGICSGNVDPEEYAREVEGAVDFLSGRSKKLQTALKEKMQAASEAMDYEQAAIYRDYLAAAKSLSETQRVVMHHSEEADVVIPARGTEETYMVVFFVREGKLIGRESFGLEMEGSPESKDADLLSAFLNQHYSRLPNIPREILLTHMPEDASVLEEYLSQLVGHSVRLLCPQRGEKRALVEMARRDVLEMVRTIDERAEAARERRQNLGQEIYDVLHAMGASSVIGGSTDPATGLPGYDGRQFRAEAYDISNTNGIDTVGAMVTFDGLKADKQGYRKFRIRSVEGQDDYASMTEVLSRRFTRVFQGDDKFSVLPDIIFMDGGKGHVSTALAVIDATGFDIPVVGMVKDDHHRTRALIYRKKGAESIPDSAATGVVRDGGALAGQDADPDSDYVEISLADKPLLFSYIGRMQEEVHRFAIEYHRKVRSKHQTGSILDEIPGIGPKRRNALLEHFKSVEAIRDIARSDDGEQRLAQAPGMNIRAAEAVCGYFRK